MEKIVIFGKGGIGKSTVAANVAVAYARAGLRVLVVGCDPKHDTTFLLTGGRAIATVAEHPSFTAGGARASDLIVKGVFGIDCIEAGGPEPGVGCAGRGIARMSELLEEARVLDDSRYDVALFDVLGDVVCGGFAAPLRQGFARKVVIVTSEELMSLYAANNIARAVRTYASNEIALLGLVANLRDADADPSVIERFAGLIGTRVIRVLPRASVMREAEFRKKTVLEHAPGAPVSGMLRELARELRELPAEPERPPTPLSDERFQALAQDSFRGAPQAVSTSAPAGMESARARHWVRLTRLCNQRCLFCLDRDAQNGTSIEWGEVDRELSEGRARGMTRVVLSGGEPTIHPRYLDIVARARTLGYDHIQTITNGRRFCYPDFLDAAVAAGLREVTVSLHGHTAALHDRLTRVPGSFVQALAGLRRALATPGLIVSVDVVICALNLPVLREHLEFCIALGVREFDLLALVPFSDAWRNRGELFCDFSRPTARADLRRALALSRRPGVRLWTNRLSAEHLEGFEDLIQSPDKIADELRGRREAFAVRFQGRAMPCAGDACAECFLSAYCRDLDALLDSGEIAPSPGPLCRPDMAPTARPFRFLGAPDAAEFGAFYAAARFFAKGSACASCADAERCAGMPVARARSDGFAALTPRARPGER